MRIGIVLGLVVAIVVGTVGVAAADADKLVRERIEWVDIWFTDADKEALPRVLMIGDSITRGYFGQVEKALAGKAYCGRYTTSRSVCDPVFFQELALVLGQYDYEVIHFNNGLHGWGFSEEAYAAGFEKFLDALKAQAPEAALVCGLSTPVLETGGMAAEQDRVKARNEIVRALCAERDIAVNDLYSVSDDAELFSPDGVHFSPKGRAAQAEVVAEAIGAGLAE
jgi:hypothetical protein